MLICFEILKRLCDESDFFYPQTFEQWHVIFTEIQSCECNLLCMRIVNACKVDILYNKWKVCLHVYHINYNKGYFSFEVRELLSERRISLSFSERAFEWLSDIGYSFEYGARPLKRCVQSYVLKPLSMEILRSGVTEGSHVSIDYDASSDSLKFDIEIKKQKDEDDGITLN